MTDKHGDLNILHYQSTKSRSVTRSVLDAELFEGNVWRLEWIRGYDGRHVPKEGGYGNRWNSIFELEHMLNSLLDLLVGINSPPKKHLLIDLKGLREAYYWYGLSFPCRSDDWSELAKDGRLVIVHWIVSTLETTAAWLAFNRGK